MLGDLKFVKTNVWSAAKKCFQQTASEECTFTDAFNICFNRFSV